MEMLTVEKTRALLSYAEKLTESPDMVEDIEAHQVSGSAGSWQHGQK